MKRKLKLILCLCMTIMLSSCGVSRQQMSKMTYPVTIDCDQVKSAKIYAGVGMTFAFGQNVTFPYYNKINIEKGATITFTAPGYDKYTLVIPPQTDQNYFKIFFAEDVKKMAKIRQQQQYQYQQQQQHIDPTIRTGEAGNMVSRDNPGGTALERTILRWHFDSDPRGARVFWRVISSVPDQVKNTNESYLSATPFEETRSFNILGLTYENSRDVTIEVKVTKKGYMDQVKRYNVRQAIDQQEISGFFELVEE